MHFSKNWKVDVGLPYYAAGEKRCAIVRAEDGSLRALLPIDSGLLQSSSTDNGKTWATPTLIFEHDLPAKPILLAGKMIGVQTSERVTNGGQLYFHGQTKDGWSDPSPIRDTTWGAFGDGSFAADSLGNYYVAFVDWRNGNPDVYFSSSPDGGKSWSRNVRIDDDLSGQEQAERKLLAAPDGVLYAFWQDNRNPDTLFDIYFSKSTNGGQTWAQNVKINDDTTYTWQERPWAAVDPQGNLFLAWMDYRDKGRGGDILQNVYFARSEDGGKSWSQNVRMSDARHGHNGSPRLDLAEDGGLICTWFSADDNPFNDILLSHSQDGGQTWSEPTRVNDDLERAKHEHRSIGWLGPGPSESALVGWLDWREGQPQVHFAKMMDQTDPSRPRRTPRTEIIKDYDKLLVDYEATTTLLRGDFSDGVSAGWQAQSGTWVSKDSMYIGFGDGPTRTLAQIGTVSDFAVTGQFLLDPLTHLEAALYLRTNEMPRREPSHYWLRNGFRRGSTLQYFDGSSYVLVEDAPFPFQSDTWYSFRTVVKGDTLNHFINDSLILATDKLDLLESGRIGIGAGYAPTYFKDIRIVAIK